jgi:hypothetical protein
MNNMKKEKTIADFMAAAAPKRMPLRETIERVQEELELRRQRAQGVPSALHPGDPEFMLELRLRLWSDEQVRNRRSADPGKKP